MRFHKDDFGPLKALAPFPRLKKEAEELQAWASTVEKNEMTLLNVSADDQAFADAVDEEAKRMHRSRVAVARWRRLSGLMTALQFGLAVFASWRNVVGMATAVDAMIVALGGVLMVSLWLQERDKAAALVELEARGHTWEFERKVRELAGTVHSAQLVGVSIETPWGSEIISRGDIHDVVLRRGNRTWAVDLKGANGKILKSIEGLKPADAETFKQQTLRG